MSAFNSRCQANYCGKVGFSPNGPPHGGIGKARSLAVQASNPAAGIQLAALTVSAGAGEQTIPIDWTGG